MATGGVLQAVRNQLAELDKIQTEKLTRQTLGVESQTSELEPRFARMKRLKTLIAAYAEGVHDEFVNQVVQIFAQLNANMTQHAARSNQEFIANRQGFLNTIDSLLEQAKRWEPYFITAAVEARGFLEDEGIRQEYQRVVEELRNEASTTLTQVKQEAAKTIAEAKALAQEVESKARRTAAGISVEEAQRQFREAQGDLDKKVRLWAKLSGGAIALFLAAAGLFWFLVPKAEGWQVFYHSALRLAILSALGVMAGFCLKVLRAYMNMRERNLHRQRVANSIEAFVASAQTPEVRDFILAHLAEAVTAFGVSGLLARDTDVLGSQRLPADAAARIMGMLVPKKE